MLGTPLMPWQRHVLDVALEVNDDGLPAYRTVVLTVPRQSGKTTLMLAAMVHRALGFGGAQQIRYTAQTLNDAREKFVEEHMPALGRSALAGRFRTRLSNGSEAVVWENGSRHKLLATGETSGHGKTLDMAVIDEAFAHVDDRLDQACRPAMVTRQAAQMWVLSTAGTPDRSAYLWAKVEAGRQLAESGTTHGMAYFEWSAAEDLDPGDPETWWSCMPALGHTVTEDVIRAEFLAMPLSEFRRAYLNQWVRTQHDQVIPPDAWARCADTRARLVDPVAFAFDVSPDQSSAAIVACGGDARSGSPTVEVVDHRPGTSWVVARLTELAERWSPTMIAADFGGPAGALRSAAEVAGLGVTAVSARDHAQACGALYAAATDPAGPKVRHRDQPVLNAALGGASKRQLADSWAWARRASSVDITPLVAATLALWAHSRPVEVDQVVRPVVF